MGKKKRFGSLLLHDTDRYEWTESHVPSLHLTSSFNYESTEDSIRVFTGKDEGHVYSRYGNPNVASVAQKIAQLETFDTNLEVESIFTTNGMSAIFTLLYALSEPGQAILTQGDLYGGTTELLAKVLSPKGISLVTDRCDDETKLDKLLTQSPEIKVVYLETPTNPTCRCVDITAICRIAKSHGATIVVDNTFCTPYLQRPLSLGADFVIHSTTKYMNGHGTGLGGAVIGLSEHPKWGEIRDTMKLAGSTGTPMDAWLVTMGLKTLKLRMDQHSRNAEQLALFLNHHPEVINTNYPGLPNHPSLEIAKKQMTKFGGMLSFDVGSSDRAIRVIDRLEMATMAPTLGDVDTLVLHPKTSSHLRVPTEACEAYGITEGLIRVSVGIEDIDDLMYDFAQALDSL